MPHGIVLIEGGRHGIGPHTGVAILLHQLAPGIVFAAGADEATLGIGKRLDHRFTKAIAGGLGDDGAIGQFLHFADVAILHAV